MTKAQGKPVDDATQPQPVIETEAEKSPPELHPETGGSFFRDPKTGRLTPATTEGLKP